MAHATIRLHAGLDDYLAPGSRDHEMCIRFASPCPVRHLVEQTGVPHTEVGRIEGAGGALDLESTVVDGDHLALYPVAPQTTWPSGWPLPPAFFADAQLGRLARYLRLLGLDTRYEEGVDDADLVLRARDERRVVLSRDRRLLMRRAVEIGCHVRDDAPLRQLAQVGYRYDLRHWLRPFSRCMQCNGPLSPVAKAQVIDRLPPATRLHYHEFWQCDGCGRLYWKGSHYAGLLRLVGSVAQPATDPQ